MKVGGRIGRRLARLRFAIRRYTMRVGVSQQFLAVATLVVAVALLVLGAVVSAVVGTGIAEGVANKAGAGMAALVSDVLNDADLTLSDTDRGALDHLFEVSSDAQFSRLVQLIVWRPDGEPIYQATGSIDEPKQPVPFAAALGGELSSSLVEVSLGPVGPIASHPVRLLRVYTPLHHSGTGDVFAVAGLYFGAQSITKSQSDAELTVWIWVMVTGAVVIAALYGFVSAANRRIAAQALRLTQNLADSRHLSEQIRLLHLASEELRIEATEANENLLARVGADVHDGPLQLMMVIQLRLAAAKSGAADANDPSSIMSLITSAMADLRGISTGLVLPELRDRTVGEAIELAALRHEQATGTSVHRNIVLPGLTEDADTRTCAYRVVQQALGNAFQHGGGIDQHVNARFDGTWIEIEISSSFRDAAGLDQGDTPRLGLRGMQLRAEALGGHVAVSTGDERLSILLRLPSVTPSAGPV